MLLNSAKVFIGIMLMIGAAEAQVGNNGTPLQPSAGARDPNVRPWPASPGTGGTLSSRSRVSPLPEMQANVRTRIPAFSCRTNQ
jgi:hypothetical protein